MENELEAANSTIAVTLHAVDPALVDQDALVAGVTAAAMTAQDADLRIVVSGAFEDYVREHDDVSSELPPYVQARVRGHAVGKILRRSDGTKELLVDASVVARDGLGDGAAERVFMHEAMHLVVGRREESTCGRRARLGHQAGTAAGAFAGMAGQIGEEYRVERALRECGNPLDGIYREQLGAMADDYADSLTAPFWAYQDDPGSETLQYLMEAAIRGFEHLTPIVAYLIGDDVGAGVRRPPEAVREHPERWFRDGYECLYEPLAAIPSATTPCPIDQLDALLDPVAEALQAWFLAVGFRWRGGPIEHSFDLLAVERLASQLVE